MERTKIELKHNTQEWLDFRRKGIGASEAASVLGLSRWMSNVELWDLKVGYTNAQDISNNPAVAYGNNAENLLFKLFALQYKDRYITKSNKNVVYVKDGFQFASLDGELINIQSGKSGNYEGKTVIINSSLTWDDWRDRIPTNYYIQLLHQLLVTGWDFSVINTEFRWTDKNGEIATECRRYLLNANDEQVKDDMKYLDDAEYDFWFNYVKKRKRPARILPDF